VPIDREDTLKKAEKLLRQGKLDAAIAEYLRVVEDQPRDWATANTLGDLYVRGGQNDKAAAQYSRIAEHFSEEGFYQKAAALYKKLLKLNPEDEKTQVTLA
jgi:tetratricopeptide (TPR) repeat protein